VRTGQRGCGIALDACAVGDDQTLWPPGEHAVPRVPGGAPSHEWETPVPRPAAPLSDETVETQEPSREGAPQGHLPEEELLGPRENAA